jgi:hypothetical protein
VHLVARGDALHRAEPGLRVARIARLVAAHRSDEGVLERAANRADDDEALAGDAALAAVDHPRRGADARRAGDVGVLEDDVGIGAAELEHAFLERRAGSGGDAAAGGHAAGQRHGGDRGIVDQRAHRVAADEHGLEEMLGKACVAKHRLDRERAAGDVARVLEDTAVAGHQRRRGEAEDLPERKVPGHHREDDAERLEGDERLRALDRDLLSREVTRRARGEVLARGGALVDFGEAVADGFAHLGGHQRGELVAPRAQDLRCLLHAAPALGEGGAPPVSLSLRSAVGAVGRLGGGVAGVALPLLQGGRVLGREGRALVGVRHRSAPECHGLGHGTSDATPTACGDGSGVSGLRRIGKTRMIGRRRLHELDRAVHERLPAHRVRRVQVDERLLDLLRAQRRHVERQADHLLARVRADLLAAIPHALERAGSSLWRSLHPLGPSCVALTQSSRASRDPPGPRKSVETCPLRTIALANSQRVASTPRRSVT